MRQPIIILGGLALSGLAGCGLTPLDLEVSPIERSFDPAYVVSPLGEITPANCLKAPLEGFGSTPPGCGKDRAIAAQVARPGDLVDPRAPGRAMSAPAARSADAYLFGRSFMDEPTGAAKDEARQNAPAEDAETPSDGATEAGPGESTEAAPNESGPEVAVSFGG